MEAIYQTIDLIIDAQKKARKNNDFLTLLVNSEALLELLPKLINYSVDMESQYRKFEAKLADLMDEGKKRLNSSAYCETQAKATDEYREWQKAKLFQELIYEMVNIGKKLAGSVDKEFNSN